MEPFFGEISKLLGKENIDLRFKIVSLKKRIGEKKIKKFYRTSISGFVVDYNTRLVFLKLINLVKKLENSYKIFFFERNLDLPTFYPTPINYFLEKSEKKILKLSFLVKKFRILFSQMKGILTGSIKFFFSVQRNVSCLKKFIEELVLLDIIGKCRKKSSILNKKGIGTNFQIFQTKLDWKQIKKLPKIIGQKNLEKFKNFSLVTFENTKNTRFGGKKKEISGPRKLEFFEEKELLSESGSFFGEKVRLIKEKIKTDYLLPKKFFQKEYFFLHTTLFFFDKTISHITLTKKTKIWKIGNFKIRKKFLQNYQKISKAVSNKYKSVNKNRRTRSSNTSRFSLKKYFLKNLKIIKEADKNHENNQPKSLDLLGCSISPMKYSGGIFNQIKKQKFITPTMIAKKIQKNIQSHLMSDFQTKFFFPKKKFFFSRIYDLDKELMCPLERIYRITQKKSVKKKLYIQTNKNQKKINNLFSIVSSVRKKHMILRSIIIKKIKIEQQIKNRLLEIKGMEADFSEIINLMKQKK